MRKDDGSVSVVVAVSMAAIMMLAAFAVDAGSLYAEQRELQNGADAAALAIAQDCAAGRTCTQASADATAAKYVNGFATDGVSNLSGPADGVILELDKNRITVKDSTKTTSGSTLMPSWFSMRGDNGTVHAKAVVTWGGLGWFRSIALTVSPCEWNSATQNGTVFPSPVVTLMFHSPSGPATSSCSWSPPNQDLPGGFGLLAHDQDCNIIADSQWWVYRDEGNSIPSNANQGKCAQAVKAGLNKTIYVPVYDLVCDPSDTRPACAGRQKQYHIAGFAAFYLTGYRVGNNSSDYTNPAPCANNQICLKGYYTARLETGMTGGGGNFGVTTPPRLTE